MSQNDDLISRQADCVLKEFGNCSYSETGCADCEVKANIRNALSAHWKCKRMYTDVSDTISRQAAIETLRAYFVDNFDYYIEDTKWIDEVLGTVPPAQPERKKGRWLRYGEDGYPNNEDTVFWQCDQCLEQYTGRTKRIPNFCPNCGADMREENES